MYFPQLSTPRQSRVTVSRFLGLDRRPRGQEGSFREMENLCADGAWPEAPSVPADLPSRRALSG